MVADRSTAPAPAAASPPSSAAQLMIVLLPDRLQEIEDACAPADQGRHLIRTFGITIGSVCAGIVAAALTLYVGHGSRLLVLGELMLAPNAVMLIATCSHAQVRRMDKRLTALRRAALRRW